MAPSKSSQAKSENLTPIELKNMLDQLLTIRENPNKYVTIPEPDVRRLLLQVREIFLSQSMLLELDAPTNICGDTHGQFYDLLRIFHRCGYPPTANYVFMGDYVDRGKHGIETIITMFIFKSLYPKNFFLLRGNHECASINRDYGFFDECKQRYNVKLWKVFTDTFNCLPLACIVQEKIFCCHGGLSPELFDLDQIRKLERPCDVPSSGIMCDLLWSDPEDGLIGWGQSDRGVSYTFGCDVVERFLEMHQLDLVCRAHQVVEDGYQFFAQRHLVTVFSAPNYTSFYNSAAVMTVSPDLLCGFTVIPPAPLKKK